jgi:hypothetical protein
VNTAKNSAWFDPEQEKSFLARGVPEVMLHFKS